MKTATPYLLCMPALILGGGVVFYPVYEIVTMSMAEVNRFGVVGGFAWLKNFINIFSDSLFYLSLWNTLIWTLAVVGGTILISVPVALILSAEFHGRTLARIFIIMPWSISLSMMAIVWAWGFEGEIGYINLLLKSLGLIDHSVYWLARPATAMSVVIFVGIFASIAFTVTVLMGGIASIPVDIYESGSVEGANAWQNFIRLTLPLLKPYINIAVVLNVIYVFNSFPIIWVMTGGGGPSDQTHILVTYLYFLAFRLGKLGEATALSLIMLAILIVFTAVYVRLVRQSEEV